MHFPFFNFITGFGLHNSSAAFSSFKWEFVFRVKGSHLGTTTDLGIELIQSFNGSGLSCPKPLSKNDDSGLAVVL